MKFYAKKDRRTLVERLVELTGVRANYTRMPRCAYEIGMFTVEKDGTLSVPENVSESDKVVIDVLMREGLIRNEITSETAEESSEIEETAQNDDVNAEISEEVSQEESELLVNETGENPTVPYDENTSETSEPSEMQESDTASELSDVNAEGTFLTNLNLTNLSVSFPLSGHTVHSITNLVCMIYTRGNLLSKATGGKFGADKELIEVIMEDNFSNVSELVDFIKGQGRRLDGLSFEDDKVIFDGFKAVPDNCEVFSRLAANMNKLALKQKRIQAKEVDETNEKFAFRVWLIRLGMNGDEYKFDRKMLLKNLSGHSAFRTEADKEKWTAKHAKKNSL